jgi:hypothetical protein
MGVENGQSRSKKRMDVAAARKLIDEFIYPDTDTHFLDDHQRERFKRAADAAAAESPDAAEVKAIENIVRMLSNLRERTELLRGKAITNITVTLCEDFSGYLGAELHHGKDDMDAPNEFCACVFCGPEELLDILHGHQAGQWFLQDESMPGE